MIKMQPIDPSVTTGSLTKATLDGDGTFDTLMRAFKVHIDGEYAQNRIRGPEYSQVYLGGLQAVLSTSLQLTLQQRSVTLANELQVEQIVLAKIQQRKEEAQIVQINAQTDLINQQRANLVDELLTSAKQRLKLDQEIANLAAQKLQIEAQTLLITQQRTNLIDELLTSKLQRDKLSQEIINLAAQLPLIVAQVAEMQKRGLMIDQQILNLKDELLTSIEQRKKVVQEVLNLQAQLPLIQAQIASQVKQGQLIDQQIQKMAAEIITENYTRNKIESEIALLNFKINTERAQTNGDIIGTTSVLGRQVALYTAQADGFRNDALQKAAQIMTDTWKVRRTTDEAVVADGVNALHDPAVGAAVLAMLRNAGVSGV